MKSQVEARGTGQVFSTTWSRCFRTRWTKCFRTRWIRYFSATWSRFFRTRWANCSVLHGPGGPGISGPGGSGVQCHTEQVSQEQVCSVRPMAVLVQGFLCWLLTPPALCPSSELRRSWAARLALPGGTSGTLVSTKCGRVPPVVVQP